MSAKGDAKKFVKELEGRGLLVERQRRSGIFIVRLAARGKVIGRFSPIHFTEQDRRAVEHGLKRAGL